MTLEIFAFVLYFIVVLGIGIYFFIKSSSSENGEKEYFLGNRSMGPWVTAMSAQASDMSGWLLMGFPGSIIALGLGKVWVGIGLGLGTIANWIFVARRLRRFSKAANDSITLPQYLTNRFASSSSVLKVVCATIFLISFTVYVASAFNAGTKVLCAIIPWFKAHQLWAMAVFASLILLYTFLGGYKAVCWTDFFQGILMLIALLAVPIVMVSLDRFDSTFSGAFAEGITAFGNNPFSVPWTDIVSGLGWGLGYFGMPHILVRFMGIKSSKLIKKSATVAITWLILTLGSAIAIACLGRTFLMSDGSSLAANILPAKENDQVFIKIVLDIFPAFIAGLMLAAIIAAAMSTADSQLLVASSSFTSDIYNPIIRKNKAHNKELLWVGRIVVLIVAGIGFAIAASGLGKEKSWASDIMGMVENAWGLFGSAFGPVVILSLFWKRLTYKGAVAGIVGGAVADIAWLVLFTQTLIKNPIICNTNIYEIVPGFIFGLICTVVFTLIDKKPSAEVEKIFYDATNCAVDE